MDETLKIDTIKYFEKYLYGVEEGLKQFKDGEPQFIALCMEKESLKRFLERWRKV
jgi:hypothetical protein